MRVIGPYEVVRTLGQGGMGTVFEVRRPGIERPLALKLLVPARFDARRLERFRREGQALARVRHPGVVNVHCFEEAPEGSYLVTDLVPGEDLDRLLERDGPFEPRRAAEIARELARAIEAVHAAGLLHRDLKPANVILTPEGSPVVVDFGLARIEGSEALTLAGAVMGTPGCMAPEQALGQTADPRTDVWGLGTVLLLLLGGDLVGMPPFVRPIIPSSLDPGLQAVCARAIAKRPADRYGSAAELEQDLGRWLEGTRPRAHRRLTRGRLGAIAGGLALAGVLVAWRLSPTLPRVETSASTGRAGSGPSGLEAMREQGAADSLTAHLGLREPFARRDALAGWLDDHPAHPRAAEARAALARTCWEVPVWRLVEPGGLSSQVDRRSSSWLDDTQLLVRYPGQLARWRVPARGMPEQVEAWERPGGFVAAAAVRGLACQAVLVAFQDPPRLELRDVSRALDGPILGRRDLEGVPTLLFVAPSAPRALVCLTLPSGVGVTRWCDLATADLAGAVLVADRAAHEAAWDARGERVALLIREARPNTTWTQALEVWALGPPPRQVHLQAQESGGTSVVFLPGEPGAVAVGGGNGELMLHALDGRDPRPLVPASWSDDLQAIVRIAHRGPVRGLGLAGERLVSCCEGDQEVLRRWDVAREVDVPPVVATTSHSLLGLVVSPDGRRMVLPVSGGLELRTVPE